MTDHSEQIWQLTRVLGYIQEELAYIGGMLRISNRLKMGEEIDEDDRKMLGIEEE